MAASEAPSGCAPDSRIGAPHTGRRAHLPTRAGAGGRAVRAQAFLSAVLVAGLVLGGLAWDVALAQAPWSDNFDSYSPAAR